MVQMGSWGISGQGWRKGPWTPEEDKLLVEYVGQNGEGRWSCVSKCAGLNRSGKSCRLRWVNYLRPGLKKGHITPQEEGIIIELHALWGNKWSTIARYLPGRTDNEIKNYWRTHFRKKKPAVTDHEVVKQEKRKFAKHQKLNHQQLEEQEPKISTSHLEAAEVTCDENNSKQMMSIVCPNIIENHDQILPHQQDASNWSDLIPAVDSYLWGGLWNLDDNYQNGCTKMAIQNQRNVVATSYFSEGGAAASNYIHGYNYGGQIF